MPPNRRPLVEFADADGTPVALELVTDPYGETAPGVALRVGSSGAGLDTASPDARARLADLRDALDGILARQPAPERTPLNAWTLSRLDDPLDEREQTVELPAGVAVQGNVIKIGDEYLRITWVALGTGLLFVTPAGTPANAGRGSE